jgi:hypothetical protein
MFDRPVLIFTYVVAFAFLALVLLVIAKMASGAIDLSGLLNESDSTKASLSRFQVLVFTFVIAGLFLILSIEAGQLVEVPNSVLGLLGISGGSYLVGKGISAGTPKRDSGEGPK